MLAGLGYYVIHAPDSVRAKAFYREVLGWLAAPGNDPGDYYHVDGSSPAAGIAGGTTEPHTDIYFRVSNAKATVKQINDIGGTASEPTESESGWSSQCADDQGTEFCIWEPSAEYAPDGPPKSGHGDLLYFVLPVADDERGKRFYGNLFGWEFTTGSHAHGWNIANTEPHGGLFGAGSPGTIDIFFHVPNIEAAVDKVRNAGGTAGPIQPNSKGWHVACTDDQGVKFSLSALRAE
jgi:predicted enzyme related to lactoylglutathione lyase